MAPGAVGAGVAEVTAVGVEGLMVGRATVVGGGGAKGGGVGLSAEATEDSGKSRTTGRS